MLRRTFLGMVGGLLGLFSFGKKAAGKHPWFPQLRPRAKDEAGVWEPAGFSAVFTCMKCGCDHGCNNVTTCVNCGASHWCVTSVQVLDATFAIRHIRPGSVMARDACVLVPDKDKNLTMYVCGKQHEPVAMPARLTVRGKIAEGHEMMQDLANTDLKWYSVAPTIV